MGLGVWEILAIMGVVFVAFYAKKLPDIAKSLGSTVKEFKKANNETDEEENTEKENQNKQ